MAGKWQNRSLTPIQARFQHLLARARWDEESVGAEVRDYVVEHLNDGVEILAVNETSFLKKGEDLGSLLKRMSCGSQEPLELLKTRIFFTGICPDCSWEFGRDDSPPE